MKENNQKEKMDYAESAKKALFKTIDAIFVRFSSTIRTAQIFKHNNITYIKQVNLLFALIGFRKGALAPIITKLDTPHNFVDPIPQALVLTAIVIALGTTALMLTVILRIYSRYKTFDIAEIKKLRG